MEGSAAGKRARLEDDEAVKVQSEDLRAQIEKDLQTVLEPISFELGVTLKALKVSEKELTKPGFNGLEMIHSMDCKKLMAKVRAQVTFLSRETGRLVHEAARDATAKALDLVTRETGRVVVEAARDATANALSRLKERGIADDDEGSDDYLKLTDIAAAVAEDLGWPPKSI